MYKLQAIQSLLNLLSSSLFQTRSCGAFYAASSESRCLIVYYRDLIFNREFFYCNVSLTWYLAFNIAKCSRFRTLRRCTWPNWSCDICCMCWFCSFFNLTHCFTGYQLLLQLLLRCYHLNTSSAVCYSIPSTQSRNRLKGLTQFRSSSNYFQVFQASFPSSPCHYRSMFVIETCNGNWDSAYEFSMWAAQIHLSVLSPGHLHSDVMTSVDWWDLPDFQIRHHLVHAKRAHYEIETGSAILWVYLWGMSSGYNPLLFRVTRMDGLMRSSLPLYTVERAIWSPLFSNVIMFLSLWHQDMRLPLESLSYSSFKLMLKLMATYASNLTSVMMVLISRL